MRDNDLEFVLDRWEKTFGILTRRFDHVLTKSVFMRAVFGEDFPQDVSERFFRVVADEEEEVTFEVLVWLLTVILLVWCSIFDFLGYGR